MTERTEALRRFPPANPQKLVPMTIPEIDIRKDYDEVAKVKGGRLYRKGGIVQVWWDEYGPETWTSDEANAKTNFIAMRERWSVFRTEYPTGVAELPTFRGYTVDYRLRQFRRVEFGKTLEFIPFDSSKGRQLLQEMQAEMGQVPQIGLRTYGPDSAARRFLDEMEGLYKSDHEEYQRRKKLIYQAIKERARGKIKTYPDISLTDLRQILHELDMLYG